ncbi:hypothetical protein GCK72_002045 [Caenorhabditis remanei]|uniref:Chitin-binding type-2 domain-containing protein n=1 Tax=Caenorhabditis remanei TaxID=31234 RepID=A0A6A5HVD9_CAERE|nr:hypothetical protein GCK72_002045 [Caenorhabditis remanei]KAF1770227.1 hypothetical protein GCK72_002045 [Caenorhabditis remanei]
MKTITALGFLALATVASGQFLHDCTNALDGLYALGGCETQFLTCSGGIARIMDCPADLIYNEPLLICDWRHNVVGCEGSGESSGEGSGENSGEGSGENSGEGSGENSGENSGEGSGEASGEGSGSGDSEGSGNETLDNVCESLEDGAYSSGGCTTYYFFCTDNVARFLSCPTPLFYDAATQKCVWKAQVEECKEDVDITDGSGENSGETSGEGSGEASGENSGENSGEGSGEFEPTCDGKVDGIYPNGVCVTNFLTCSGGIARVMNCPASLVFNPSILVCDWPRDVAECSGLPVPKPVCEEDGYFSFGQCSSSFTACTNQRAIVMFCPAGLKFSEANQRCDYDDLVSECQDNSGEGSGESSGESSGEASGEQSGEGSGEASGEQSGEGSGEQTGEQTECVGLENGLHAIGCSPRVLSCQNGHVDIFECPSSLVFNEQTSICDYPQTSLKCLIEDTLLIDETSISAFDCSTDGLFSDGLCSSKYHQCTSGQLINFTCAESNAVFSAANAECVASSTLLQCQ